MSSRSKATSTSPANPKKRPASRARAFALCLRNGGYEVSLEPRKIYEVLPDREAAEHHQLRVIDESGEDYVYPSSLFVSITLPQSIRRAVFAAV